MKNFRFVLYGLLAVLVFLFGFALWYRYTYSMETVQAYEVNSPTLARSLLIAAQGSEFKNSVVEGIVDHYKSNAIFIKVVDISALENMDVSGFDAILLIHTWEYRKPPEAVQLFMDKNPGLKSKMVVLSTSGEGSGKMEGVDAITGESIISDVSLYVEKVIIKLHQLLETGN